MSNMRYLIEDECSKICNMLLSKNASYGDSACDPVRIFSELDPIEQLNVRIDDKLSRIMRGHEYDGDDTEGDLIGYLILKRCVQRYLIDEQDAKLSARSAANK